ncbi:MAG: hypothetical protein ACREL7_01445 [Longimicrobiales bacterium]
MRMNGCWLAASAVVIACTNAGGGGPSPAPANVDPAVEAAVVAATGIERPLEIEFDWTLQEQESRFNGKGLARIAPPYNARVDLFGPRGEAVLAAALVEDELRLPAGTEDAPLPPPALFWTVLGVFRAPAGATLAGTESGTNRVLEYTLDRDAWTFRFEGDRPAKAEWTGESEGRRTVEISGDASHGLPTTAVYRDWPAFRELRLTVKRVLEVDGFPPEIWSLGGQ